MPEILAANEALPQSSAYRNVTALIEAGVVRRVTGVDDHGRFELSEDLAGHHHHLACARCGKVEDVVPSGRLEQGAPGAPGAPTMPSARRGADPDRPPRQGDRHE